MNCQGDPQGITANAISKGDGDVYHAAGLYMAREVWEQGIVVKEEGGDGEPSTKRQKVEEKEYTAEQGREGRAA